MSEADERWLIFAREDLRVAEIVLVEDMRRLELVRLPIC